MCAGGSSKNSLKDQAQYPRVGHVFYPDRRIAMRKLNAALCRLPRCRRVRRLRSKGCHWIGLRIGNDRQHGPHVRIFDQQTLSVQFAPSPHLIGVDAVVASDPCD